MKKITLTLLTCLTILSSFGQQQPIDVAELTIKIRSMGSEEMFYGFAEGDQIVFSFEELKGKDLKKVEIIELPSSSKFMDYKTSKIENKTILVNQKGVYHFKYNNSALAGRICKVKIQRIPKTEDLISLIQIGNGKIFTTLHMSHTRRKVLLDMTLLGTKKK